MAYVAVSAVSGLTVATHSRGPGAAGNFVLRGHGTYTAADFYLDHDNGPGFTPSKVEITNLTDGTRGVWFPSATGLTKNGYTQVAAGDKTTVAAASAGVSINSDTGYVQIDVSACCPITDNDDFVIECFR